MEDSLDDQFFTQEAIDELNRLHGQGVLIKLVVAGTAEEASRYLESNAPVSLILLDVNLPKESGLEFLQKLKLSRRWRRIPVVMLTTSISPQDVAQAHDSYCNAYLRKPITHPELFNALKRTTDLYLKSAVHPPPHYDEPQYPC